jgi:serine carboxypeptidase 1
MESVGSHGQLITAICKECMQFLTISIKFVSVWVFSSDVRQDFYNLLQHETSSDSSSYVTSLEKTAARHLRVTQTTDFTQVMNGPIRKKLGIIPSTVSWSQSSFAVFGAFVGDFMKDTISQVDELLALNVNLTIYSGQLDLICCTAGTDAWLQKLK